MSDEKKQTLQLFFCGVPCVMSEIVKGVDLKLSKSMKSREKVTKAQKSDTDSLLSCTTRHC